MALNSVASATGQWAQDAVQVAYDKLFAYAFNAESLLYPLIDKQPAEPTNPGSSITLFINQYFDEAAVLAATTPLDEEADVTPRAMPRPDSVTLTPTEYGDAVAATHIRKAVTKLDGASVPRRGGAYLGVFHPDQIHDLREESGSGSWRVPNEYGTSQTKIWNGEFGMFEGVRFISNPRSLWAADLQAGADKDGGGAGTDNYSVYHGYILGKEALAKAVVTAPQTVVTPVVDRLKRFYGLGWKADLDTSIYRQESVWEVVTGSSLGE
jgi:hypothetical protein